MKNNKNNRYMRLFHFGTGVVLLFFSVFVYAFFIGKLTATCHVTEKETVLFFPERILTGVITMAIMLAGIILLKTTGLFDRMEAYLTRHKGVFCGLLAGLVTLVLLEGVLWVSIAGTTPIADQAYCLRDATGLIEGNYASFQKGGYIYQNTNQIGLVLYEALFLKLFPGVTFHFFYYLNTVFAAGIVYLLTAIAREIGCGRVPRLLIGFFAVLFPLLPLYSTFVYGTLPGMFLGSLSVLFAIRFAKEKKWWMAGVSALILWMAIFAKENFLIFGIAISLYLFMTMLSSKEKGKLLLVTVLFILVTLVGTKPAKWLLEKQGVLEKGGGLSPWSFVVMGLSPDTSTIAPGWWDSYNWDSFVVSGDDRDVQAEKNKEDLVIQLRKYKNDPKAFIKQMYQKQVSQWCDTSYESLWVSRTQLYGRRDVGPVPSFYNDERNARRFTGYMNGGILFLLLGLLAFCYGRRGSADKNYASLLLMIITIGGALFHIFWEAKSQYTYVYVIFLLPLMARGFEYLMQYIGTLRTQWKADGHLRIPKKTTITAGLFLALTGILMVPMHAMAERSYTGSLEEYIRITEAVTELKKGNYYIRPAGSPELAYVFTEEEISLGEEGTKVYADVSETGAVMLYVEEERCLVRDSDVESGSCAVHVKPVCEPKYCEWYAIQMDDGSYIIRQTVGAEGTIQEDARMSVRKYRYGTAGRFLFESCD